MELVILSLVVQVAVVTVDIFGTQQLTRVTVHHVLQPYAQKIPGQPTDTRITAVTVHHVPQIKIVMATVRTALHMKL